ncbi:phosphoglycerate mutase family protein [Cupriavidus necator]|uniref:phosphoglycerate mutase family protein n=1 Tax=Cupriavidus necator TaxID=106590 RepID=UPI003ECE37ED
MTPDRIMIIRHAEKPVGDGAGPGIDTNGAVDSESLTVRGWQRAGALARFFCPNAGGSSVQRKPDAVFATGSGPSSTSKRSMQTVAPLVALLRETSFVHYVDSYLKDEREALMKEVLAQPGVVLIAWEHKVLPSLVGCLSKAPAVPARWPDDRYDMVWVLDRTPAGWSFAQLPQLLLAGDSAIPISA